MENVSLDSKLTRIETSVASMRDDFSLKTEDSIEVVAARAIAGPQAEECMRIYDLLQSPSAIDENNYNESDIARVDELLKFYLPTEEE
jgi:hypothetical protein